MKATRTIRGIRDIIYPESNRWKKVIDITENLFEGYGYKKLYLPVIEYTELFCRSIGEETDIVSKEMYSFQDRKGRNLSLRPEGTAGTVRAMIEGQLLQGNIKEKVYYFGPMFRYERPQEGRYRQFYQMGCEVFGSSSPLQDVEITEMAVKTIEQCGVTDYVLNVNSVGCEDCRKEYRKAIKEHLKGQESHLCDDCQRRLDTNTLRILDCKNPKCREIYEDLPLLVDYLCDKCCDFFLKYEDNLKARNIEFTRNDKMVRGLDYYTGPVFEIEAGVGTVIAGGRYDGLVKQLGGPDVPACGWGAGIERLLLVSDIQADSIPEVYVALLPGGSVDICRAVASGLRDNSISVEEDYDDISPGKKFKMANKLKAKWVIVVGEEESVKNEVSIKNMKTGDQESMSLDKIDDIVRKIIC